MVMRRVEVTGFLNGDSLEGSLFRLAQGALDGGISDAALRSLVRLTCAAHGLEVAGLDQANFEEEHLGEMKSIQLIHRPTEGQVKMV